MARTVGAKSRRTDTTKTPTITLILSMLEPLPQRAAFYMNRDPAAFDAPFFGISPSEASALDPQQRFLLESTFECLESAGIPMERISGSKTGYFAGSFLTDYDTVTSSDALNIPTYAAMGSSGSLIPNRCSWFYNLKGPSVSCDTACSSSLIAFHLACQSIWSGESELAFAAGASMIMMPNIARALTQMQFLA
ncbi:polyketide synthase [Lecanosticta acicola]|uniref:Polyketide synthase n=1 Tax=Lecanosticta acicola TaxID=111012 RepID=A0AAI8YRM5_9PEZI|nr:polyketide synthase [Lecanosticta acicola]